MPAAICYLSTAHKNTHPEGLVYKKQEKKLDKSFAPQQKTDKKLSPHTGLVYLLLNKTPHLKQFRLLRCIDFCQAFKIKQGVL